MLILTKYNINTSIRQAGPLLHFVVVNQQFSKMGPLAVAGPQVKTPLVCNLRSRPLLAKNVVPSGKHMNHEAHLQDV